MPPARVWPALTTHAGVGAWWNIGRTELTGDPGVLGQFRFQSGSVVIVMEVAALDPPAHVAWRPVEANAPGGWIGTAISFDLAAEGAGSRLDFAHRGFAEDHEGYRRVTEGWGVYLRNLKRLVEIGSV